MIDLYSRLVVWRLADDMGAAGVCARAEAAFAERGTPSELHRPVAGYVEQCNGTRPHRSLGYGTPSEWCYSGLMAA